MLLLLLLFFALVKHRQNDIIRQVRRSHAAAYYILQPFHYDGELFSHFSVTDADHRSVSS